MFEDQSSLERLKERDSSGEKEHIDLNESIYKTPVKKMPSDFDSALKQPPDVKPFESRLISKKQSSLVLKQSNVTLKKNSNVMTMKDNI